MELVDVNVKIQRAKRCVKTNLGRTFFPRGIAYRGPLPGLVHGGGGAWLKRTGQRMRMRLLPSALETITPATAAWRRLSGVGYACPGATTMQVVTVNGIAKSS